MPYFVEKTGKTTWRLSWRKYKERSRVIQKDSPEARNLGFHSNLSYEEAKELQAKLQDRERLDREAKSVAREASFKVARGAYLTDKDAAEFERDYLKEYKIRYEHWHSMQKIIVGVRLHPSEWFQKKSALYEQFLKRSYSANYAKKLLRYLNIWGYFLCLKENRPFMKVPGLDGMWRNRLEQNRKASSPKESLPITPALLTQHKGKLSEEEYRWLFISVWFGLRPREIDSLRPENNPRLWKVTQHAEVGWVLSIFQEKLHERGVKPDYCWKHLPTVFEEQKHALRFINEGRFERPVGTKGKKLREVFGRGYTHYGGRNNFSGMLRDAGYDQETRRRWLGHLSSKTTEEYDRKTEVGRVYLPKIK